MEGHKFQATDSAAAAAAAQYACMYIFLPNTNKH